MAGERITIDISILQGIFGDLTKLQQQLAGVGGSAMALDSTASGAFSDIQESMQGVVGSLGGVEAGFDATMRGVVGDLMQPIARAQELEAKLARLGQEVRTSKSVGEITKLKKEIAATQKELDGVDPGRMESKVGGAAGRMRSMFSGLVAPIAGAFAVGGVVGFTKSIVGAVAGAEKFNASMKVMLGGQEQAAKMSKDLRAFALATPFDVAGLREYTVQLNSANVAQKDIIPTLDTLGNIAAGVGSDKLPQIVRAFTQMKGKGSLMGGELLQFQEAGVPLLDELEKVTGKKASEISGNIAKMSIPFETVRQALENMTAEGGNFHNLMAGQAATIGGQLSAAGEEWAGFLEDMGTALLPQITSAVQFFTRALDGVRSAFFWVKEHGQAIKEVIVNLTIAATAYGAILLWNNRALIQNNALKALAAIRDGAMALWTGLTTGAVAGATTAQWSWNAALLANPIGLVIAGIALLVGAVLYCWNHFGGFRAFLYGLWASVKVVFSGIGDVVGIVFGAINRVVMAVGQTLAAVFSNPFKPGYFENVANGVKATATAIAGIADVPGQVIDKMRANGVEAGMAYAKGAAQGRASFQADQAKKTEGTNAYNATPQAPGQDMGASGLVGGQPKADGSGVTVGGEKGIGRVITMNIEMKNSFALPKDGNMGAREVAERVIGQLVAKLNDAQFAMG
ncbi:MAG TPA: tape measure protein [Flavobacteriales bacterium]|nr:tape measure protein [Flavobacteriales bacterium]